MQTTEDIKLDDMRPRFAYASILRVCAQTGNLELGRMIHGLVLTNGLGVRKVLLANALIQMYSKCGRVGQARLVFDYSQELDGVSWNSVITGYVQSGMNSEMMRLLVKMHRSKVGFSSYASNVTFSAIIKGCNACQEYEYGKQMHAHICKRNLQYDEFIGSSLVELYSLLGSIKDGMKCFSSTTKRDIITWTSIIMAHAQSGEFEGALSLFCRLLESGPKPDEFTISIMLSVCADLAAARSGEQIQGYAIKSGIDKLIVVHNSLLSMYARCGDIDSARLAFESTDSPDVVSWSVMICGSAQHGRSRDALSLFELMKDHQIAPNHITFLGVLTACSHGGLVEEGLKNSSYN
ncbi:hypothetical protein RJ639_021675 [Escallonia herrerae]|uniref:Pentatricopeptide repeat-containing protein n=1 Tax=Escallonia herrerae TaxID=1293975 RepID=A0AA88V647_9ASTE|nr:hypothetical protein RJ639_021675 [Escallonia herrerae]